MARPKRPRDLDKYIPRKQAATALAAYVKDLRRGNKNDLVKWDLKVSFWYEEWGTP